MKLIINADEIKKIRNNNIEIGRGFEGICYLLDDRKTVVKLFHVLSKDTKIEFVSKKNPQIAFPIDELYDETTGRLAGYTMNYLQGKNFYRGFNTSMEISKLKNSYLMMRIIMLKLEDIYMGDNCLDNMLYDYENNKINIIDTSRWIEKTDGHFMSICDFNWQMMLALLKTINWYNHKLNDNQFSELHSLYKIYDSYIRNSNYSDEFISLFINFIIELEKQVSEYNGKKANTLDDLVIKNY